MAQGGVSGVAVESRTGRGLSGSHQVGKRPGQSVQSAAHDPDTVWIVQVGGQSDLRRLVLHVAPQVRAAQPAPQFALGLGEEVLGRVVRALHERHYTALLVPRQGMPEEVVPVGVEAVEHDRFRTVPATGARPAMRLDSPAQLAAVPPELEAEVFFTQLQIRVLRHFAARRGLAAPDNLGLAVRTMAILGGYLYRKNAPPPGYQTIWEGWSRLTIMAEAYELRDHFEPLQTDSEKEP